MALASGYRSARTRPNGVKKNPEVSRHYPIQRSLTRIRRNPQRDDLPQVPASPSAFQIRSSRRQRDVGAVETDRPPPLEN